jgi:hypothetical protein
VAGILVSGQMNPDLKRSPAIFFSVELKIQFVVVPTKYLELETLRNITQALGRPGYQL